MKNSYQFFLICVSFIMPLLVPAQEKADSKQQLINIGDLKLENGKTIYDCQIGLRTFGRINEKRSNIILFPTWFSGTTENLERSVPGGLIDSNEFFIILVDALGDGISSSPSNSPRQPGPDFPSFSIRDMVESQYKLLTEKMHITHLYAVAGISMGGMQAFQWSVSHPDFEDKVISIVGSPQLPGNDLLLWNGELKSMESDTAFHGGHYQGLPPIPAVTVLHQLAVATPEYYSITINRPEFDGWFTNLLAKPTFDWNNWHRQLEAMIGHDIAKPFGSSLKTVAGQIRAKMLVIVSKQDHMVSPIPATELAGYLHARLLELNGNCGHLAPGCESVKVAGAIKNFLATQKTAAAKPAKKLS